MSNDADDTIIGEEENQDESAGEWTCSACGNLNFAHRPVCNMRKCRTPRNGVKLGKGKRSGVNSGGLDDSGDEGDRNGKRTKSGDNWICKKCGNENYASRTLCNMRKCRAPREEWICPSCGNLNYKHRTHCNMRKCGAPRPLSTMSMGTLFGAPPSMAYPYGMGMSSGPESDIYGSSSLLAQQSYPQLQALMGGQLQQNPYLSLSQSRTDPTGRKPGERKEGDWSCPKCGNLNYVSRTRCNMRNCKEPKPQ